MAGGHLAGHSTSQQLLMLHTVDLHPPLWQHTGTADTAALWAVPFPPSAGVSSFESPPAWLCRELGTPAGSSLLSLPEVPVLQQGSGTAQGLQLLQGDGIHQLTDGFHGSEQLRGHGHGLTCREGVQHCHCHHSRCQEDTPLPEHSTLQ